MDAAATYRHFDHTADVGIEAEAGEEAALFEICARALFDILAGERAPIEEAEARRVEVEAPDREILLLRWLRELLYLHDAERWLFSGFAVRIERSPTGAFRLAGEARGEKIDPARHRLETEVKAVTYHMLEVGTGAGGRWRARVIFDV